MANLHEPNDSNVSSLKVAPLTVAALLFTALTFSACNTFEGAGRDIESVGDEIEDAAD